MEQTRHARPAARERADHPHTKCPRARALDRRCRRCALHSLIGFLVSSSITAPSLRPPAYTFSPSGVLRPARCGGYITYMRRSLNPVRSPSVQPCSNLRRSALFWLTSAHICYFLYNLYTFKILIHLTSTVTESISIFRARLRGLGQSLKSPKRRVLGLVDYQLTPARTDHIKLGIKRSLKHFSSDHYHLLLVVDSFTPSLAPPFLPSEFTLRRFRTNHLEYQYSPGARENKNRPTQHSNATTVSSTRISFR
jgi:hypothetical protein